MFSIFRTIQRPASYPMSRVLFDIGVAVAAMLATAVQLAHGGVTPAGSETGRLDTPGLMLAVCSGAPLLMWRRAPLGVFTATTAASTALAGLGYPLDLVVGPTVALYLLAATRREASWSIRTTLVVIGLLATFPVATAIAHGASPATELVHSGLATAGAWFAGERTRLRREQVTQLRERAHLAEHEAEQERLLAVAEERTRIARDLHDSAGHTISVIAVRAGAARLRFASDPDGAFAALKAVEELARQTGEEIDHTVATLREIPPANEGRQTPHSLASLGALIDEHATTGLTVVAEQTGAVRPLNAMADQAAYRILQEALTNAARYGTGNADVCVAFGEDRLDLIITNPVTDGPELKIGGGHGLIGMRERATLLGGSLDATRSNRVFRVHAWIPYEAGRA